TQVLRDGAGGNDQRIAGVGVAAVALQLEGAIRKLYFGDVVEHDFGVEPLGMSEEALHQFRPLHAHGVGWPVIHVRCGHQLAPLLETGDQHGGQVGTCRIDRGAVSRRTGTKNEDSCMAWCGHCSAPLIEHLPIIMARMARLPATPSRSSRNVRNGPSPLQTRLSGLAREARWIVFAALAVWLGLVLSTWDPADPAWSHSVHSSVTQNRGGILGAHVADFLLFLFGYSAWLWVVLLTHRVVVGFLRLTGALHAPAAEVLPRVRWEIGIGFTMLFIGCMGIEALHLRQLGAELPAEAGGQLGRLLADILASTFGLAGCTLGLLVLVAVGASLFFGFSWLHVAERVGTFVERGVKRILEFKAARDDRRVGQVSKAKRDETVVARQVELVHE